MFSAGAFPEMRTTWFAGLGWGRAGGFSPQGAALPQTHMEFRLSPFSLALEPRLRSSTGKLLSTRTFFFFVLLKTFFFPV